MRPPVNLSRLRYHPDSQLFLYEPKAGHELDDQTLVDPLEFLARVLIHIPEPEKRTSPQNMTLSPLHSSLPGKLRVAIARIRARKFMTGGY